MQICEQENIMKNTDTLFQYNEIIKENDDIYRHLAKSFGMPECTFWILYSLRANPDPLTQSELCRLLYEPKQTIHSALKKLENEGYLVLTQGGDRRSKVITLTAKGEALASGTIDAVISAEEQALFSLNESEQNLFLHLFHKYTDALKKQIKELKKEP